jgi:PAS domain S-box-containing protein
MITPVPATEERVLVLMPTAIDTTRACEFLEESGLGGLACLDIDGVCTELIAGAGIILLTEEALQADGVGRLRDVLADQPSWSDVPLVVLSQERSGSRHVSFLESVNATLVERPVRMRTLLSVVQSALRARRRQYEVRDYLEERHRIEETIRAERERLRITLASIGDAVISTDGEGRVTFLNGVAETLTGWPLADAAGRSLEDIFCIVNEHTRRTVENPAMRALREGAIIGLANHTVLVSRDGKERPIDDSAAPIRDSAGQLVGAVLVFRDVTERKRAEETLARLAAIVECSDDAIVSKTLDGVIRSWNAGAERLFGYTAAEAVGQSVTLIIPPDRLDEEHEILSRLSRGERVEHFETIRMAKDGRRLNVSLKISPIRDADGKIVGASKVARDITQRVQSDVALRTSEERYRALFESMSEGFCVIELMFEDERPVDYRFLEMNPAFAAHTGWGDSTGRTIRELLPHAEVPWLENCGRVAVTGEPLRFLSHAKSTGRWYEVSAYRSGEPQCRRVAILLNDMTERKLAEDALREADRRKDEFIALLAHELRNPLAPIRNGLQVMRFGASDPQAVSEARTMMERQLGHMVRLIDDLLDVSRIARNKMELRRSRVALADVLSIAVETARPSIDFGGHGLSVSLPPKPVFLDADLTRLAQVFSNLLNNSAKYTPHGGHIWLAAELQGENVLIHVRDDGIGIPPEFLDSIFNMFSQVDRSIERSTGGLGIGLALVKGLVEMHGGSVTAECPGPGRGSTFTVQLSRLENDTEVKADDAKPKEPSSGFERRFLIVDDNRDAAASMAMMLQLVGHEVRTANDGMEAIEVAEQFRPEVILMDVGMPRLNGYEATRRIREQPWGKAVTVIALTGWGQEGDRAKSREAGCDGHLVKPVSLTELDKLLARLSGEKNTPERGGAGKL